MLVFPEISIRQVLKDILSYIQTDGSHRLYKIQTPLQLIVDFHRLEQFMDKIANVYKKPVIAGIFLLKSAKNAQFINKYVPGVDIPDSIIERLDRATDPLQEGIAIAAEQVKLAKTMCQGVHLMAVKKEELIPKILDLAGIGAIEG